MFLVLGNVVVDEAMTVDAWPAPGQTVVVGAPRRDLGGKGANQALMLARAGAPVRFVAPVGRDADGNWIADTLRRAGLPQAELWRTAGATDRSLIFVSREGENAIASTTEAARSIDAVAAAALVRGLETGGVLLLQGNLTLATTRAALEAARSRGVRTVFNPSPIQAGFGELLGLVDLLVLNESEAAALSGSAAGDDAVAKLRSQGAGAVVLTLGGRGAVFASEAGHGHVPARAVKVVDTTGAGDTFAGVLAAAVYQRGLSVDAAIRAATEAAALTVQRPGTLAAFPSADEVAAIWRR